jgi:hypothetical protein
MNRKGYTLSSKCSGIGSFDGNGLSIPRVLQDYPVVPLPEQTSPEQIAAFRAMLAVSSEQLDQAALGEWVHRRGLEAEWRQVST